MYIDAHCHLYEPYYVDTREKVLQEYRACAGQGLIITAVDLASAIQAAHIADVARRTYGLAVSGSTVGVHPSEACFGVVRDDMIQDILKDISDFISQHKSTPEGNTVVAIGECGIDLHYEQGQETLIVQQNLLRAQCHLACDTGLPMVIHSRDGLAQTCAVLDDFPHLSYYFHCFGYGKKEVDYLLSHYQRVVFGIDCNVSYPKAQDLRDVATYIPLDHLLLETDAPYLPPQPYRGDKNTPLHSIWLYEYIAALRAIPLVSLQHQIFATYCDFYGFSDSGKERL